MSSGIAGRFQVSDTQTTRVGLATSRRSSALGPFGHLADPLGLANREPAVPKGARGFLRHLDVEHIALRLHEGPELRSFRLVPFPPHPREPMVLLLGHGRQR